MPNPSASPHESTIYGHLPASTILQTTAQELGQVPEDSNVAAIAYTPEANITGAASPASRTLTLYNRGQSGAGTTVVGTLAFIGGVNGVANDEIDFTLSGTATDLQCVEGDVLQVVSAPVGGTGLADPGGEVTVTLTRR